MSYRQLLLGQGHFGIGLSNQLPLHGESCPGRRYFWFRKQGAKAVVSSPLILSRCCFQNKIILDPMTFSEARFRPSLEERLESIISGAALMADSSCTRDDRRERIVAECNAVRQALQDLLSEYMNNVSPGPSGLAFGGFGRRLVAFRKACVPGREDRCSWRESVRGGGEMEEPFWENGVLSLAQNELLAWKTVVEEPG